MKSVFENIFTTKNIKIFYKKDFHGNDRDILNFSTKVKPGSI